MGIHWFLWIALLAAAAQGLLFRCFGLRGLTYERSFNTDACFEGEEIEMVERIANRSLLPVPWLRLESLIHAGLKFRSQFNLDINDGAMFQNHKSLFSLLPYTRITRRHHVAAMKRGWYRLNSVSLTGGDLLGIYRKSKQLSPGAELLVYPRPAELEGAELPFHSWQGDRSVRRWIVEDPFMISGVRDYRYGDAMNGINWKATARTGRLQVRQHDYTADQRLMILVNVEDHEKMWNQVNDEDLFERGLAYAASFARLAIGQGMEAGFATNAHLPGLPLEPVKIEPANGPEQMTRLLEAMAKLVVARSIPFDDLLEECALTDTAGLDFVILTPFVSEKMTDIMDRLRSGGNGVSVFLVGGAALLTAEQAGVGV